MTNKNSPEKRRLSKFSNVNRAGYGGESGPAGGEADAGSSGEPPLAHLLEHLIRDGSLGEEPARAAEYSSKEQSGLVTRLEQSTGQILPQKLIEELQAAQEQVWVSSPSADKEGLETQPNPVAATPSAKRAKGFGLFNRARSIGGDRTTNAAGGDRSGSTSAARAFGSKAVPAVSRFLVRFALAMRLRHWHRRYFNALSRVHRQILDRKVERLLFIKTPSLHLVQGEGKEGRPDRFVYQGPLPSRVLNWVLSAVPVDLKRYAFVDFHAGNGRTLLLATRRNFECAAGYVFDAAGSEELEMNIAQYPRSYMSCRDVRVMRGDREGVAIPQQPCVLFFPDSVRGSQLDIIMSHVSASFRLNPRPIYLLFENATRKGLIEHKDIFKRQHMPLLNRIKAAFFSPANVAVYRSIEAESIS